MKCVICRDRPARSGFMCALCQQSFDRMNKAHSTTLEALVWAARRARQCERARHTKKAPYEEGRVQGG